MQKVIFDSSFLMAVVEKPTTWLEDMTDQLGKIQPVLLSCVKAELEGLASGQGKKSRSARLALELASEFAGGRCGAASVDAELVSYALSTEASVATIDSVLLSSLKAAHVKAITLRRGRVSVA